MARKAARKDRDDSGDRSNSSPAKKDPQAKFDLDRWLDEIKTYERSFDDWQKEGDKLLKKFKDDKSLAQTIGQAVDRYNIRWANHQSLAPSYYSNIPVPQVGRRYQDNNPIARLAANLLERGLEFTISNFDFDEMAKACRDDWMIPCGRGTCWLRYIPHFQPVGVPDPANDDEVNEDTQEETDLPGTQEGANTNTLSFGSDPGEEVVFEEVRLDYVHWKDFGHTQARIWEEVRGAWRICYLTKEEIEKRFDKQTLTRYGLAASEHMAFDWLPDQQDDKVKDSAQTERVRKSAVYEIWEKSTRRVFWVAKSFISGPLDEMDNPPINLKDFWPFPKPLFANLTSEKLIPRSDMYFSDSAVDQLDAVCDRRAGLRRGLRLAGVYNASFEPIRRLVDEAADRQLIPVENWGQLTTLGGLEAIVQWLPVDIVVQGIQTLAEEEKALLDRIYAVSGVSDIMRGDTDPNETLGAQQIKRQTFSLRQKERQKEMSRFLRDGIRLLAEVISENFQAQTILVMTDAQTIPGYDPNIIQQALDLLKDDVMRTFQVDIETDSTLETDEAQAKEDRNEFLDALTKFTTEVGNIKQTMPELVPAMQEILLYYVRGFKVGRAVESAIELAFQQAAQAQAQAAQQPPPPDPKLIEAQTKQQIAQMQMQLEEQKSQHQMQLAQQKAQNEGQIAQQKANNAVQLEQIQTQEAGQLQEDIAKRQEIRDQHKAQLDEQLMVEKAKLEMVEAKTKLAEKQEKAREQAPQTAVHVRLG